MPEQITQDELNERVAILRRFKAALVEQRDRFRRYLDVLENGAGQDGTALDDLEFHVEMEKSIVQEIATFERTIEPLEQLYRAHDPEGAKQIPVLRNALERTREEVVRRTSYNRDLLRAQLESLREEISELKLVRSRTIRIPDAAKPAAPAHSRLVDVTA
jgi:hypothetical protein